MSNAILTASYLATLKCEDGEYSKTDERGDLHLGTWEQALGDLLGFCGCGDPEAALGYVLRILRAIDLKHDGGPWDVARFSEWYESVKRPAFDAIFHGDAGAQWLAYYLLDDKGLTEHGGSVPGWLTDLGKGILADLEAHSDVLLPNDHV